jgi:hypothetical protein
MPTPSEAEINEAVRQCTLQCARAPDTAECLAAYARELMVRGWSIADSTAVIESARSVLESIGRYLQ